MCSCKTDNQILQLQICVNDNFVPLYEFLKNEEFSVQLCTINVYSLSINFVSFWIKVVYILDQVRALENEMLLRIEEQGLDVKPKILIVSMLHACLFYANMLLVLQPSQCFFDYCLKNIPSPSSFSNGSLVGRCKVTRLIPDAKGTTCNQRIEKVSGTEHTHILRVPFRTEKCILRKWISRFDVWPYLETFAEVQIFLSIFFLFTVFFKIVQYSSLLVRGPFPHLLIIFNMGYILSGCIK